MLKIHFVVIKRNVQRSGQSGGQIDKANDAGMLVRPVTLHMLLVKAEAAVSCLTVYKMDY